MNKQQMQDREQFRRYAEAALSGLDQSTIQSYGDVAWAAFKAAIAMMLQENMAFEHYQIKAAQAIVDDERIKHEGK
jgi:fatty acid/phospholipid biosynthesis enzyme